MEPTHISLVAGVIFAAMAVATTASLSFFVARHYTSARRLWAARQLWATPSQQAATEEAEETEEARRLVQPLAV